MKRSWSLLLLLPLVALVMLPGNASALTKFKLFGALSYVAPLSDSDVTFGSITDAVGASSSAGYDLGLEYRMSSLLGIELDYLHSDHDLEGDALGTLGTTSFNPIMGTLNFHLPIPVVDLYGGPTAAYVNWGDLELENGTSQEIDPEFAVGLSAGAELGIFTKVSIMGGLRWLNVEANPDGTDEDISVHPLFARIGLALHL